MSKFLLANANNLHVPWKINEMLDLSLQFEWELQIEKKFAFLFENDKTVSKCKKLVYFFWAAF